MRLDEELLDLAAAQRSCIADWQARLLGASYTEVQRLHSSTRWAEVNKSVLAVAGVVHDELLMTSASVLASGPGGVLSHEPSVALWGHEGFRLLPAVVSQTSGHATRGHQLGRVRDLVLVPERWVTTFRGIRVVRPELAAYQACGVMSPRRAARVFDWLWSHNLLDGRSGRRCL